MTHLNTPVAIEALETRQLLSATPAVVGYLPDYRYTALGGATLDRVNWDALTQVNYFSVKPDAATGALPGTVPFNSQTALPAFSTNNRPLSQLTTVVNAAHAHGVEVHIVIGGAGYDETMTTILADPALHLRFAQSLQSFASIYDVDGVDLDWELQHPTLDQIHSYGDFIKTVQDNTTGLVVSAAVYPEKLSISTEEDPSGYSYKYREWQLDPKAIASLDQISVMDYDLDFADHSQLGRSTAAMDAWAGYLEENGQLRTKLLFGVPFYGKAGKSWNWLESDAMAYNTLIDTYNAAHPGAPASQTLNSVTAELSTFLPADLTEVWHFNSVSEIQEKTHYAIDHGFGGVMAWDIGMDHLVGANVNDDPYSLLAAIRSVVNAPLTLKFSHDAAYHLTGQALTIRTGSIALDGELANRAVTVNAGATAVLGASQHLAALTVNGLLKFSPTAAANRAIVATQLTLGAAGKLDLAANDLIVRNGNLAAINAAIATARTADNTWAGPGLTSANAAADMLKNTTLAAARAGALGLTTFANEQVTANDLVVRYTLNADANLDRAVDFNDLLRLAQNYNGTGKTWSDGDFTNDGAVDFNDLLKLAQNYNTTLNAATPAVPVAQAKSALVALFNAPPASTPKPAAVIKPAVKPTAAPRPAFSVKPITRR